ncbi:wall-associated receptor kinase-like 8 isoform X1 [Solanum tuberosum]|nr:PREDICTED: wall-associated receptor kinase-like 8 isoform X1 [Solanum tuberosum]
MPLMLKNTTLPVSKKTYAYRPSKFCDEIELYETANVHPHLAKLSRYCCDRRLAVVYDEELTTALSDVLPADDFGWDKRMNVATQLADLLAWLHKKKIAVGSIIASCIMIDKEVNIKVFDFGYICNRVNEDSVIPLDYVVGRYPEDVSKGWHWTMKSDVYIFGLLLMELITKTKLGSNPSVLDNCKPGSFVHKSFEDVDDQTVFGITSLACGCVSADPGERPTMKMVLNDLDKLRKREGKRKRDENESTIE